MDVLYWAQLWNLHSWPIFTITVFNTCRIVYKAGRAQSMETRLLPELSEHGKDITIIYHHTYQTWSHATLNDDFEVCVRQLCFVRLIRILLTSSVFYFRNISSGSRWRPTQSPHLLLCFTKCALSCLPRITRSSQNHPPSWVLLRDPLHYEIYCKKIRNLPSCLTIFA